VTATDVDAERIAVDDGAADRAAPSTWPVDRRRPDRHLPGNQD
jgi:hypothetical protein